MNPFHSSFLRLLGALDRLEILYMIAGSAASSLYGVWRSTNDVDIVARIRREDIKPIVEELRSEFYVDDEQISSALERQRSFNVIHLASSYKFDIFPLTQDRFHQVQFGRRRDEIAQPFGAETVEIPVATPEDVILSKLDWYRRGGKASEQQWNDVLGVIAVQRDRLDMAYLSEWAAYLKISDLLDQALAERHEPMA